MALSGCAGPAQSSPQAAAPTPARQVEIVTPSTPTPIVPLTTTRDPAWTPFPLPNLSVPTASPSERQARGNTWLYLTAFQFYNVSVIDPLSAHALREFPVTGDQAGMAVAPDGTRLYIVDGQGDGELRIYDTANWQVIHREPIVERSLLLGGNPIALSGDGRWLVAAHVSYKTRQGWRQVYDTQQLQFLPGDPLQLPKCTEEWLPINLVGRVGHARLYAECHGFVAAVNADTLNVLWQSPAPTARKPMLVLAPDGKRLYGLYPHVVISYAGGYGRVTETDLQLNAWDTQTGQVLQQTRLSEQVTVPTHTFGRGEGGYLAIAPDGARLFVAWEDRLWTLASDTSKVRGELQLPAPVDGMTLGVDSRELYLLPATACDLHERRERGLWTVDTVTLKLIRRASDWPSLTVPFMFAAPAAR